MPHFIFFLSIIYTPPPETCRPTNFPAMYLQKKQFTKNKNHCGSQVHVSLYCIQMCLVFIYLCIYKAHIVICFFHWCLVSWVIHHGSDRADFTTVSLALLECNLHSSLSNIPQSGLSLTKLRYLLTLIKMEWWLFQLATENPAVVVCAWGPCCYMEMYVCMPTACGHLTGNDL